MLLLVSFVVPETLVIGTGGMVPHEVREERPDSGALGLNSARDLVAF